MMLVGEPARSGFKLCEIMHVNTPLRSGNKPAHQHDEPWRNILSNFLEKPLTETEKNKQKKKDSVANQHNSQHWVEFGWETLGEHR